MTEDVQGASPGADPTGAPAEGAPAPETGTSSPGVEEFAADTVAAETPRAAAPEIDYKDRWLRSEADLQNYRRRAQRDREESVARGEDAVLLEMIAVLDDLDRALAALAGEQAATAWAQGVALTAQRMRDALARWNVSEVVAVGQPFDPNVHEALLEIPAPDGIAPGAVAQVVQKGYRRGERALRAARVVVARAGEGA